MSKPRNFGPWSDSSGVVLAGVVLIFFGLPLAVIVGALLLR